MRGALCGVRSWCSDVQTMILATAVAFLVLAGSAAGAQTACSGSQHTITFQNECGYPIWIANAANVVGGSVIGGKACSQTSDCCVTLPDGTQDCTGVNCANGYCSQINCLKDSDCPSPSGTNLVSCNVPVGVQCSADADCAAITCSADSDCPPNATCSSGTCQNVCQGNVCACASAGPACPGAGTICDVTAETDFGFCAGGACQYNGLVPENGQGTTAAQWELAATCSSDAQCASQQTCNEGGQCTCGSNADCAGLGGTCSGGVCVGQAAVVCMQQGWGGRFWGRTGCAEAGDALQCQTGQCGAGSSAVLECTDVAAGITQTATGVTLFEGTWDSNGVDFWDVSLVNGYNIPLQVAASVGGKAATCTFAGTSFTGKPVGCSSDLNDACPTPLEIAGKCNCVADADCPQGQTCGADNLCAGTGGCTVVCIDPGDYCTSFGLYGNSPVITPPAALKCNDPVSTLNTTTYNDYYSCTGPLSALSCNNAAITCFADNDCPLYPNQVCQGSVCMPVSAENPLAQCVGGACNPKVNHVDDYSCQTVQGSSLCLPNAPTSTPQSGCCGAYNPDWMTAAQAANGTPGGATFAEAFRTACPLSYAFQFDDVASSFQCSNSSGEVDYLVTFCPVAGQPEAKPKAEGPVG